jgi:demethylspheroidene O-methyltransferase
MPAGGNSAPIALGNPSEKAGFHWHDGYLTWRDRLLADRRFQRWAAGFPLTRKIAQRRAQSLFDLCAGFVYSQILLACVKLGVFDILAERPLTLGELASRLALTPDAALRLLNAAAALRLVQRRSRGRFGLGVLGAALLANPEITTMVAHHGLLYADLLDPVSLLRRRNAATALSRYWPYAGADQPDQLTADEVADYTALMSASQSLMVVDLLDAWTFGSHRCLLDVGGGDGSFVVAAAARAPGLRFMLYDLPAVTELARGRIAAAGLADRAAIIPGDFFTQPLPSGADIITLVRVLHDHDDANALKLLRNVRRVLPHDGVLLIAEPMSGTTETKAVSDAYFAFYLLAMGTGRARSPSELKGLLQQAGFDGGRAVATRRPILTGALVARPIS